MVGPWFTTPWRLVSQSHGAVAWCFRPPCPSHVPFPFASSLHRPVPSVPWTPYPVGPLCGSSHTPFPAPSPCPFIPCLYPTGSPATLWRWPTGASSFRGPLPSRPRPFPLCRGPIPSLIPCLYPTGPPATLWRGPTGSSSIRGPFRAPSTGRSLPAPFPRAAAPAYSPGLSCGPIPSLFPCLYCNPTGPPATLWRGPTGSSSFRGPFCAPCLGRSPPAPAPLSRAVSLAVLVFWAAGVHAPCVVLRARCPGPPGSCSPVCTLRVWCCVYGVLGLLAPVHRCARPVCGVACTVSWASRLRLSGVHVLCVVLRLRPGPLGSCSPACTLSVCCCVRGVLGRLAPVHRCACFGALCRVYGVLGPLAPVHRCARFVCDVVCAASWASWLLFTGACAR